jgi:membrane protein insertase Oxa1/YidC/SpoIIIJ
MNSVYKDHKCTRLRAIFPALLQVPLFITASMTLRAMSGWGDWLQIGLTVPVEPLLQNEGFGSIIDLTQPDSSFVLPVMLGLLSVTNIEVSLSHFLETLYSFKDDGLKTIPHIDH